MKRSLWIATAALVIFSLSYLGCAEPKDGAGDGQSSSGSASDQAHGEEAALSPTGAELYGGLIQYRGKDAKPAIFDPVLLEADDAMIAGGTKVIGVYIGGQARAYPLFMLNNHQVVNDKVAGIPLSASW
jgi:hypothetical protein